MASFDHAESKFRFKARLQDIGKSRDDPLNHAVKLCIAMSPLLSPTHVRLIQTANVSHQSLTPSPNIERKNVQLCLSRTKRAVTANYLETTVLRQKALN